MKTARARLRTWGERFGDVALAGLLGLIGVLEVVVPADDDLAASVATIVVGSALLVWRRSHPEVVGLASLAVIAVGETWADVWSNQAWPFLIVMVLVYTTAAELEGRRAVRGLLLLALALVLGTIRDEYDEAVGDWAFVAIVGFAGPAIVGWLLGGQLRLGKELHERNAQLEREREERAARAVAEERARIARELHDVVAHSVSIMVIQAAAARRVMTPAPERAEDSFGAVESTGRDALAEMRRLLGLLRPADEEPALRPQPGVERIGEIVDRARAAGLRVEFGVSGDPAVLTPAADVAAYRVAQEAITNVAKHAEGARVRVSVSFGDDEVVVEVADDGSGSGPSRVGVASGLGLDGLRERVALQGGAFDAGPQPDGGFRVCARFPRAEVAA